MDTPATESQALNIDSATDAFTALLNPEPPKEEKAEEAKEPEKAEEAQEDTEPAVEEAETEGAPVFTIKVDGKEVELTEAELAEHYKNGLRQSDYTRKTMEAAEQRKAAEAELNQARADRQAYLNNLNAIAQKAQEVLAEQNNIDWKQLLDSNPVEYLKQRQLYEERQAVYQRTQQEQARVWKQQQEEQAKQVQTYLAQQQQDLLAKLPDWKDEAKAKAESTAIGEYLRSAGYDKSEVENVSDHRAVILARKAMLYDQMMDKARVAAKKVAPLPTKVERPGSGERSVDKRGAAFQRLSKTGSIEDGAAVFASLL